MNIKKLHYISIAFVLCLLILIFPAYSVNSQQAASTTKTSAAKSKISKSIDAKIMDNSQTFNSSGTFTIPDGITSIQVEVWGGGGNGGGGAGGGGGGGGGGGYARDTFNGLTSGTAYTVTVGGSGGTSSFSSLLSATGGSGGGAGYHNQWGAIGGGGGSGGSGSGSPTATILSGGNGASGGSCASTNCWGQTPGGTGGYGAYGGAGGVGGASVGCSGNAGSLGFPPGGGGGGGAGLTCTWGGLPGAAGAGGRVVVTWGTPAVVTPEAPTGLNFTNVAANVMRLNWTDNSNNEDGFAIERSEDGSSYTQISTVGAGVTTYDATSLSANKQYWFKVRAYKGANYSGYTTSNKYTLANRPGAPNVIGAYNTINSYHTHVIIGPNGNPANTEYAICTAAVPHQWFYGDGGVVGTEVWKTKATWEAGNVNTQTNLALNTPYTYEVMARNTENTPSDFSAAASGLTPAGPTPDAPTGLSATLITVTSAHGTWEVPLGSPASYMVSFGTNEAGTNNETTTETATAHDWTGLTPSTKYYWKVSATNQYGTSEDSSIASFETLAPVPPAKPTGLTTTGITSNSADSTWEAVTGATSYTLSRGTDEVNASNLGTLETSSPITAHSWTGLTPSTPYYWKVSATNQYGTSEYSSIASFETFSLQHYIPPLVTVEAPNGGDTLTGGVTYEIKWSATDETGVKTNGITLRYSANSGSSWSLINTALPNTGVHSWEAAKINSIHCRVSVEVEDIDGNIGADMSDADFTISTEGVSGIAPTIEAVRINGILFRSGDIISSNVSLDAVISSEAGVDPFATVLKVDNVSIAPPLGLVSGTPTHGTWRGVFTITPGGQQIHILSFHLVDVAANASDVTMEAKVMGGTAQVIGTPSNYPNPFNPMSGGSTNIQYILSRDATVTLIIYDITGHEVRRMRYSSGTNGGRGGTNQVSWNGQSMGGEVVGNGMYLYKIIADNKVIGSSKLVVFE